MFTKGEGKIISDANSILLIQLGDIGDVVLSFPCVRALRERFPHAKIIVAVREKAAELIDLCPWADGVISVVEGRESWWGQLVCQWRFLRLLRSHNFDLAIDLRTGTRGAILAFLSGARERVGFYSLDGRPWRDWVFSNIFRPGPEPGRHMSSYLLALLEACGITTNHPVPEFAIPKAMEVQVDDILNRINVLTEKPLVAVQPFSLWGYKELSEEKYVQIICWIRQRYQLPVLVVGGPGERERAQSIVSQCEEAGEVFNLAGETSIGMYGALLHRCSLFVGVDSAGQHLAAASGVASVVIYGPSCPATWAPQGEKHIVVQKGQIGCVPCNQAGCEGKRQESRCLQELSVAEIIPFVERQLQALGIPEVVDIKTSAE
ncbi:MAG: glycosyltransferase family 9 protein [Desulfobulbaceae bacterium]|nr:glycosyltransferase family 9 protein [Desulfobulbaceae bacterium]